MLVTSAGKVRQVHVTTRSDESSQVIIDGDWKVSPKVEHRATQHPSRRGCRQCPGGSPKKLAAQDNRTTPPQGLVPTSHPLRSIDIKDRKPSRVGSYLFPGRARAHDHEGGLTAYILAVSRLTNEAG